MKNKKAKFVISIDTELAWGTQDLGLYSRYEKHYSLTRDVITDTLRLFNDYDISATWAIVGHLFLEKCDTQNGKKHPEILRPNYKWMNQDWFNNDPCTNIKEDPHWYGKDIVELIKKNKVPQEIGSHSFSHFIYGDRNFNISSAESDLIEAVKVANEENIKLNSFIFPRNSEGYHELLYKHNFKCYRGKSIFWYDKFPNPINRMLHVFDQFFAICPKTINPLIDNYGLINIPDSMFLMPFDGVRRIIPSRSRVLKAKKGIDLAIKKGEVFHLWFHPFNLASNPEKMIAILDEILNYASTKIDEGLMENITMEDLAAEVIDK